MPLSASPFSLNVSDAVHNVPAAVLWDMDGTLLDSEKLWTIGLEDYAVFRGAALTQATRQRIVGSNMTRSLTLLLEDLGLPARAADVDAAVGWVARRMAELFEQPIPWRPGAREALAAVRASGVPSALVTSTVRELTDLALETLGRNSFDVTVCGDEVGGANKPDPEPYLRACRRLGVAPEDTIAIEDSPTGVSSAETAGCTVLVVPCELPVEPGRQRILRESLESLKLGAAGTDAIEELVRLASRRA